MKKIFSIFGPTGIGKSSLAIELAKKIDGEIIGVDSRQIYNGIPIGTAQPNPSQLKEVPHHLIGFKKLNDGISDITRFTLNSTLGIGGFIDVASGLGLDKNDEDFGQTLAVWGVSDGPYLVLPGLGPSTMRDTLAMIPDAFLTPLWLIDHDRTAYSLTAIDLVDTRARYLGLESVVIGDEYLFFRDAYLQSREFEILDGQVDDDFDEFDDFN